MLSSYSAQIIAFVGDGFIVCRDCAVKRSNEIAIDKAEHGLSNSSGLSPLCRYTCESEFADDGLYCEDCHTELVEPPAPTFVVVDNMPGYLPESEPAEFDNYDDAVEYMNDRAREYEDDGYVVEYGIASRDNFAACLVRRPGMDDFGRVIEVIRADN